VTTQLQKAEPTRSAAVRRSDASLDRFVLEHMARGDRVVHADAYTQSMPAAALQIGLASAPLAICGAVVTGSLLSGLAMGAMGLLAVGLLMFLETTNRIAITERALVVQMGALVRHYDRDRIDNLRVDRPRRRELLHVDLLLLDPALLLRGPEGLRFRYRKPSGKSIEVFVAVDGPEAYAALLQPGYSACSSLR